MMLNKRYYTVIMYLLLITFLSSLFIRCSQHNAYIISKYEKSYTLGEEDKANVGNAMLKTVIGSFVKGKRYIGTGGYGEENWFYYEEPTGDSFKQELIYTGRSGSTIFVSYREYRSDFARPAFFQDLRYDLEEGDIIVFRDYRIQVFEATSEFIKFVVLED